MKKIILSAALAATSYFSNGQAGIDGISYGIKGGLNMANVKGKDVEGTSSLLGFHGGVQANIPLNAGFSLQPEFFYSAEGAKMKVEMQGDGDAIIEGTAKTNLSYVNLPVLLKYQHASGAFAITGPQIGYLLSAKVKMDGESENVKDGFKKINFGWTVGVGYMIPATSIGVDVRYNFGLSKLTKAEDGQEAGKAYTRVFQAGVFYKF
jgi:opacity protein-like surface antigen